MNSKTVLIYLKLLKMVIRKLQKVLCELKFTCEMQITKLSVTESIN